MPRGQSPKERMGQRYTLLLEQLKKMPRDYSTVSKLRRKVDEFLRSDDNNNDVQYVTTQKRQNLLKKIEKIESNVGQRFRSSKDEGKL